MRHTLDTLPVVVLLILATPALAQVDNAPRENVMLNWGVATILYACVMVISVIRSKREHRD